MQNKNLAIVIPAFNEEDGLGQVLDSLSSIGQIILIDDASTDLTSSIAAEHGCNVITNTKNMGYEKSLEQGIKAAKSYEYIITIDADGEIPSSALKKCLAELEAGACLVLGTRTYIPRWSEKVVNLFSRYLFGVEDILCGMKGYKSSELPEDLNLSDNVATGIAKKMMRKSVSCSLVKVCVIPRVGDSKYGSSLKVHLKILKAIFRG